MRAGYDIILARQRLEIATGDNNHDKEDDNIDMRESMIEGRAERTERRGTMDRWIDDRELRTTTSSCQSRIHQPSSSSSSHRRRRRRRKHRGRDNHAGAGLNYRHDNHGTSFLAALITPVPLAAPAPDGPLFCVVFFIFSPCWGGPLLHERCCADYWNAGAAISTIMTWQGRGENGWRTALWPKSGQIKLNQIKPEQSSSSRHHHHRRCRQNHATAALLAAEEQTSASLLAVSGLGENEN